VVGYAMYYGISTLIFDLDWMDRLSVMSTQFFRVNAV